MASITFGEEEINDLVNKITEQLIPVLVQELKQNELPHLLTSKEFMELVNIGSSKCNELFHRKDFPVNRELGHPRVPTKEFFEWVNATMQNAEEVNLEYPFKAM